MNIIILILLFIAVSEINRKLSAYLKIKSCIIAYRVYGDGGSVITNLSKRTITNIVVGDDEDFELVSSLDPGEAVLLDGDYSKSLRKNLIKINYNSINLAKINIIINEALS